MSKKLASHISYLLGVDEDWLMKYPVDKGPVPAAEEGELVHSDSLRWAIKPPVSRERLDPRKLMRSESVEQGTESTELRHENQSTTRLEVRSLNPIMQTMIADLMDKLQSELTSYCDNAATDTSNPFTELYDWIIKRAEKRSASLPSLNEGHPGAK